MATDPLSEVIGSKIFTIGGPEYGIRYRFSSESQVKGLISGGYEPPVDLNLDTDRLRVIKRTFRPWPQDQIHEDNELRQILEQNLNQIYGVGMWTLASLTNVNREQRGEDDFWQPPYLVLLRRK